MTPLQKAAQALLNSWDSPRLFTDSEFEELRKALDAEIAQTETVDRNLRVTAQAVEPDFYTACAEYNGGWIPLPGYSNETEHGVKSRILEDARKEGWKGTIEGRLFALGWQVMPVYLHPHQPQATTPVPKGYVLVPLEPTEEELSKGVRAMRLFVTKNSLIDFSLGYKAMLAAAQGEKP